MGHSSLVDCPGGQVTSSITTNCGQDANQASHERLHDVDRVRRAARQREIDREHLESYVAKCERRQVPGHSATVSRWQLSGLKTQSRRSRRAS